MSPHDEFHCLHLAQIDRDAFHSIDPPRRDGMLARVRNPGLARLIIDILAEKMETAVVYKVGRLSRSPSDFAKMVEVFEFAKRSASYRARDDRREDSRQSSHLRDKRHVDGRRRSPGLGQAPKTVGSPRHSSHIQSSVAAFLESFRGDSSRSQSLESVTSR